MIGQERYADECATCKTVVYVHVNAGVLYSESFCATCRIANALEAMIEVFEDRFDSL